MVYSLVELAPRSLLIKEDYHEIELIYELLKGLVKSFGKIISGLRCTPNSVKLDTAVWDSHLADGLHQFSLSLSIYKEDQILSDCMDVMSHFSHVMKDLRSNLSSSLESCVIDVFKRIMNVDIPYALAQKDQYDHQRLLLQKFVSKNKRSRLKSDENNQLANFNERLNQLEKETIACLKKTIVEVEDKMIRSLIAYMDYQEKVYANGLDVYLEIIPEICNYRRYMTKMRIQTCQDFCKLEIPTCVNKIFGLSLQELDKSGKSIHHVPKFLIRIFNYIETVGKNRVGIFKFKGYDMQPPLRNQIEAVEEFHWDHHQEILFNSTDMIKLFLSELPESLVPIEIYDKLHSVDPTNKGIECIPEIQAVLSRLKVENRAVLIALLQLLNSISRHEDINLMNSTCLANSISPFLTKLDSFNQVDQVNYKAMIKKLITFMIIHALEIFPQQDELYSSVKNLTKPSLSISNYPPEPTRLNKSTSPPPKVTVNLSTHGENNIIPRRQSSMLCIHASKPLVPPIDNDHQFIPRKKSISILIGSNHHQRDANDEKVILNKVRSSTLDQISGDQVTKSKLLLMKMMANKSVPIRAGTPARSIFSNEPIQSPVPVRTTSDSSELGNSERNMPSFQTSAAAVAKLARQRQAHRKMYN